MGLLSGLPVSRPLVWGAGKGHFIRGAGAPDPLPCEFLKFLGGDPRVPGTCTGLRGGGHWFPACRGLGWGEEMAGCTHIMYMNPCELKTRID